MTEHEWPGEPLAKGDPSRIGPYTVLGRLGAGGMGRIYLGRSPFGRLVAIKTIRSELGGDPGFRARFAQEVAAARRVSGVFTAAVVNADPDAAVPWLATAYVPAPSLETLVRACGPLPASAVQWLAAGIAEALESVHAAGLVHRDLKPSNVLVAGDGPKVIDFGISRAADFGSLTMTGVAVGTPAYMSPEQAQGVRDITPASDVFSLGATLVYAATAHSPYPDRKPAEALLRLVTGAADLTGLPDGLHDLIGSCMQRAPEHRPSPTDLLTRLAPVLDAQSGYSDSDNRLPEAAAAMVERFERQYRPAGQRTPPVREAEPEPSPEEEPSDGLSDDDWGKLPAQMRNDGQNGQASPADAAPGHGAGPRPSAAPPNAGAASPQPSGPPVSGQPHGQPASRPGGQPPVRPQPQHAAAHAPPQQVPQQQAPHHPPPPRQRPGGQPAYGPPPGQSAPGGRPPAYGPPPGQSGPGATPAPSPGHGPAYAQQPPPTAYPQHAPPPPSQPNANPRPGGAPAATPVGAIPTELAFRKPPPPAAPTYVADPSDAPRPHPPTPRTPTGPMDAAVGQPWRFAATAEIVAPPVRAGGARTSRVHVHSKDNGLHTLHLATREWRFDSSGWSHPPAVEGDMMYLSSQDNHLYALELTSRQWRWSFPTNGEVVAAPVVVGGVVYFGSSDNAVYAVDAATGRCLWRHQTHGWATTPTVVDGTVYFGSSDRCVYAVDAASGWARWRYQTGGWVSAPTVSAGVVHVGSTDHYLYLLDAATGTLRGWFAAQGPVAQPAAAGGVSFFGSGDGGLYAVDVHTTRTVWRYSTDGWVTSPVVAGNTVYAGSSDHTVVAVATTGEPRWKFTTGGRVTSPIVADGLVFVGSGDRHLYVMDAATGGAPQTAHGA
ncbi:PQQ-binding-like beta-propeller repeat protein [Yinghuangia sp. ASG 101]|uniref:outer membrane protein assembly factor BamB family protein n=1 Tax=Yinghuangia sp. ASG 101 TaxID=2896848 RepID=UPI001E5E235C|nr:PQQ-binding-like beta-propeller repeat protein [Yinghuangia sp. ASG 101]UGQ10290.1 PQQ-binding-like beta-propeller repeat protein [Yinghuangia sp. ASG 101]